jgi:hypothetical protein
MRRGPLSATVCGMSAATGTVTIEIVLDLEESLDHPRGTAALPDGTPRPFHGWLGLAAAIESLTEERRLLERPR